MRVMRDEPEGIMLEPISEVGAAHVGDLRELAETAAAFAQADIEASQFDELFAIGIRTDITDGGQDGRGGGGADPRQRHEELEVRAWRKSCNGVVEPPLLVGQGVSQVVGQGCDCKRVDAVRVGQAATLLREVVELLQFLRAPLATALTRLPCFQEALASMAQDGRWRWIGLPETSRGGWWQGFAHRLELGQRQVYGGSQVMTELAAPFFQRHGAVPQAVGGLERSVACNREEKVPLAQHIQNAVGLFCIGFTGGLLHGLAVVAHRLAAPKADVVAAAAQSVIEPLPGETGRCHGDPQMTTAGFAQVVAESLFKEPESLTAMGTCKFSAGEACLGPDTGMMFGLAHINSNEQKSRLVHRRFTLLGVACILFQSHGTLLLL
jgi:hypothetical protein